jgi:4-hydroxy 2-oxovalerate aldolase
MSFYSTELVRNAKLIDCTLRDGGHLNKWNFSFDFVKKVISAVAETGIHCIEIGYVSDKDKFPPETGTWRFSEEKHIRAVVPVDIQTKIGVMGDVGKVGIEQFIPKDESVIDIVRLAFYPGQGKEAIELGHQVQDLGYEVYLNAMGVVCYKEDDLKNLISDFYECKVPNIVISDSYGSLMPWQVHNLTRLFIQGTGKSIGYHAHNNLGMAFANSMASINAGGSSIDATVYGMGRGAGNLPLETILAYLLHSEKVHTNLIPLLELIENEFVELKKRMGWGYNLPYMISGLLKCHPNYALTLIDQYNADMTSTWTNLTLLSKKNPVKYDKKLLDELVKKGGSISLQEQSREDIKYSDVTIENVEILSPEYINRHKGRDFLILGAGPSLKTNIEKIKKFAQDNNLIVMGANYLHELIEPDYHAFNNISRFLKYGKFVDERSKLLIGNYISVSIIKSITDKEYEGLRYLNSPEPFDIKEGIIQSNCGTISILLIGIAIVMGANNIYVAGLDGYKKTKETKTHFYDETHDTPAKLESMSIHDTCEKHLEEIREYQLKKGMKPFKIITETGYGQFFDGGVLQ